jgi:FixJ family two-component response regulator
MVTAAQKLGVEVLAKPFAASELIAAVEKALGGKSAAP